MYYRHIVLTGFMGTGKSTVGRLLAIRLGRGFVDTDALIEARCGRTIAQLFAEKGEAAFRAWESVIAQELAQETGLVIATGGGLMLNEAHAAALSHESLVICLTADPATILARIQQLPGERPLLNTANPLERIQTLLNERASRYNRFPQIATHQQPPEQIVAEILTHLTPHPDNSPITPPLNLTVTHPEGQYPVVVGRGVLSHLRELAGIRGSLVVVTDEHVGPLHAHRLGGAAAIITVPAGEQHKNLDTVRFIYEQMLAAGLDRQGTVVALGGGVVGDMAGFAAATFMRGVPFVQCPTTVLSMVDASVGGKVGVDLPQGKNLVGAFKQPQAVIADLDTLNTLPLTEFRGGLAELIKHGFLARPDLLTRLASRPLDQWRQPQSLADLQQLLFDAIQVKRDVVERDPFERGERAYLNLGHTFAHAIEQVSGYQVSHGEAVAMGLVAAAVLSHHLGHGSPSLPYQTEQILTHVGLPIRIPTHLPPEAIFQAMTHDKKKSAGQLRFVLLHKPGQPFITSQVTKNDILSTLVDVYQKETTE
ncbi:MAG: 3-dehydroquinate synthase [Chloroflexi bacterium]|nr:3-dehydroquinate synthase [Chloroflexota bacterium]